MKNDDKQLRSVLIIWAGYFGIPIAFLFGLLLGVLLENKGIDVVIVKEVGPWIASIGALVAAFFSFRSAKFARQQSKTQLITATIDCRKKTYKSMLLIESLLNGLDDGIWFTGKEQNVLKNVEADIPIKIFVTSEDIEKIRKLQELFWIESLVFGKNLHGDLSAFHTKLLLKLRKQQNHEFNTRSEYKTLPYHRYKEWLDDRKELLSLTKSLRSAVEGDMEIPNM